MLVTVGRIGRAHGVRGELSIDIRTDEPERRFAVGSFVVVSPRDGSAPRPMQIRTSRPHSGRLLVTFEQVPDRTAAEALRGANLAVEVDAHEPPDDPEEFYDHQLVELQARAVDGTLIGVVSAVLHLPAQDTLSITAPSGHEILVPFVAELVPQVDLAGGFLVVSDLPGLLDPDAAVVVRPAGG